jgi:hypothetical protein
VTVEALQCGRFGRLEEYVPDRNACVTQVPIGIEFQVYDPVLIPHDVRSLRLTIHPFFSGPTIIRDVRQAASFYEALTQPSVSNWLSFGVTAKSLRSTATAASLSVPSGVLCNSTSRAGPESLVLLS